MLKVDCDTYLHPRVLAANTLSAQTGYVRYADHRAGRGGDTTAPARGSGSGGRGIYALPLHVIMYAFRDHPSLGLLSLIKFNT